jgi:hypothetical protein
MEIYVSKPDSKTLDRILSAIFVTTFSTSTKRRRTLGPANSNVPSGGVVTGLQRRTTTLVGSATA